MKIGIAGAGSIVPSFMEAQAKIPEMEVLAISATKNGAARLKERAKEYDIPHIFYDYDEMLALPELDVIYVAVPNHLHYEFAKKALEQGKSVILEKPFCETLAQAKEIIALARKKRLFLFEAITTIYFPNFHKVKELLPKLGDIGGMLLNYTQYSSRYDHFLQGIIAPVFDPQKAGGALMDLNVYNIHMTVGLFGEPKYVRYYPTMRRGIDISGTLILEYDKFSVSLIASKASAGRSTMHLYGDKAFIGSASPVNSFQSFSIDVKNGNRWEPTNYALNKEPERLYYELRAFADMYGANDFSACKRALEHTLIVQKVLDHARGIK